MASTNYQIKHEAQDEAEESMHTKTHMSMHMHQDYNTTYGEQHKIMSANPAMHPAQQDDLNAFGATLSPPIKIIRQPAQ